MDTEANKAVVRHIPEKLRPGNLGVLEGRSGYWQTRQAFLAAFAAFPDFRMAVERQIAEETGSPRSRSAAAPIRLCFRASRRGQGGQSSRLE